MSKYENIIREIFPSEEMADYLVNQSISKHWIADAIACAPIPIERKLEIFSSIADDDADFAEAADCMRKILRKMELKSGEVLFLICYYFDESGRCVEDTLDPYLKWEYVLDYIRKIHREDDDLRHYLVMRWTPNENDRLINTYDYRFFGDKLYYAECNVSSMRDPSGFERLRDLYLPIPFHAGDIVTIDCRPFAPLSHAVILRIGDNFDCCSVWAMYREEDGTYKTGALKHGYVFPHSAGFVPLSPLYRLTSYKGELSESERILGEVSSYIDGTEERGEEIWDFLAIRGEKEWKAKTETQILEFIERKRNTTNGN